MHKTNPLLRIWGLGKDQHGRLICAVLSAFVGVAMGIKDKTVMIITHRMRTVAGADKIVVLSDGKVAEQGNSVGQSQSHADIEK